MTLSTRNVTMHIHNGDADSRICITGCVLCLSLLWLLCSWLLCYVTFGGFVSIMWFRYCSLCVSDGVMLWCIWLYIGVDYVWYRDGGHAWWWWYVHVCCGMGYMVCCIYGGVCCRVRWVISDGGCDGSVCVCGHVCRCVCMNVDTVDGDVCCRLLIFAGRRGMCYCGWYVWSWLMCVWMSRHRGGGVYICWCVLPGTIDQCACYVHYMRVGIVVVCWLYHW